MQSAGFVVWYGAYTALTLVLVFSLRAIKSTWQPPPVPTVGPTGFGAAISLRQAAAGFLSHLCPRLLAAGTLMVWALRIWLGQWTWIDAALVAALLVSWPFVEWSTHHFLLHWRPITILGRRIEPIFVITHRAHHENPWDPKVGLAVPYIIAFYVLGPPVIWLPLLSLPQAITASAVQTTLLLNYEWMHYLIHTSYQPRSRLFKSLWRHHRLHHFKSEQHWFGVTATIADAVLRSMPSEKDVARSPTCLNLEGAEEKLAQDGP